MENPSDNEYRDFLSNISNTPKAKNAFTLFYLGQKPNIPLICNLFGPNEDLFDFEIKCLIYFHRVISATPPNNCLYVFCSICLKKWNKISNKLPMGRNSFSSIIKVYYSEPWVK